ncbi:MAG: IPT/TIG domain-containing protein [Bryobacteraceae bacterium]
MTRFQIAIALLLVLLVPAALVAFGEGGSGVPFIRTVDPGVVKPGATVTASGDNLSATNVQSLMLTKGDKDTTVNMVQQTTAAIKFKLPAAIEPGRYSLTVLTAGKEPMLIEQPVFLTVEKTQTSN